MQLMKILKYGIIVFCFEQSLFFANATEGFYIGLFMDNRSVHDKNNDKNNGFSVGLSPLLGYNVYVNDSLFVAVEGQVNFLLGIGSSGYVFRETNIKSKVSYRFGPYFPYVFAGLNYGLFKLPVACRNTKNNDIRNSLWGAHFGLGISYLYTDRVAFFAEYRKGFYLSKNFPIYSYSTSLKKQQFSLGVVYHF